MKYRIAWRKRALAYIRQVIHTANELSRADGAEAAYEQLKRQLAHRPSHVGESRDDPERVLIVAPFAVFYEVFEPSQTVLIYRVHYRGYPKIDI